MCQVLCYLLSFYFTISKFQELEIIMIPILIAQVHIDSKMQI